MNAQECAHLHMHTCARTHLRTHTLVHSLASTHTTCTCAHTNMQHADAVWIFSVLREEWEAQEIAGAFRYEHLGDMIYDASAIVEQILRQEMAERREILRHKAYSPAKGTTTNKVLVRIL